MRVRQVQPADFLRSNDASSEESSAREKFIRKAIQTTTEPLNW
jgi:hypothetical protein